MRTPHAAFITADGTMLLLLNEVKEEEFIYGTTAEREGMCYQEKRESVSDCVCMCARARAARGCDIKTSSR